jgi:hypothetical protein
LRLVPQSADPSNPEEGELFRSDGTSRAEGTWEYKNSNWSKLFSENAVTDSINNTDSPYAVATTTEIVFCDTSSGAITVNLPTAVSDTGRKFTFKLTTAGNTLTIDPNGAQTIDGATTFELRADDEEVTVVSDGANWQVISRQLNEYVENELAADYLASSPSAGVWQVPSSSFRLDLEPGSWDIDLEAMMGMLTSTSTAGNSINSEIAFATSSTGGTGIVKAFSTILFAVATNQFAYEMMTPFIKNYVVTSSTSIYVHIRFRNFGGSTTAGNFGFRSETGSGNGMDPILVARRVK